VLVVSATPGPYELRESGGVVVEQIIRPTGLLDPVIEVRPVRGQVDDLLAEIRDRASRRERVLVTTLTKRMAEDLTQYYQELGVKVRVRTIAVASENFGVWPLLPAVAVMLITLFVWSLAQAAPVDGVKELASKAYQVPVANIAIRTLPTESTSEPSIGSRAAASS
jgi:hypothetical protein